MSHHHVFQAWELSFLFPSSQVWFTTSRPASLHIDALVFQGSVEASSPTCPFRGSLARRALRCCCWVRFTLTSHCLSQHNVQQIVCWRCVYSPDGQGLDIATSCCDGRRHHCDEKRVPGRKPLLRVCASVTTITWRKPEHSDEHDARLARELWTPE